jgi:cation diffusion facilitator CzcD-associated flavoprotein CzcO
MPASASPQTAAHERQHVVIIGSGFAGLCIGIKLKEAGIHDFVILERGDDVGGTWRDNHYPGAACDVPSNLYSFSFEPNPNWSRKFPTQPELYEYQRHCARKYGLLPHVRFHADVAQCRYDEAASTWTVHTRDGRSFTGAVLVSGVGGLSNPAYPSIPGLDTFAGPAFHSATWDHGVDLRGKRIAVIGSGASAIQFVPQIAPKAARLDYYQRTPPWVMPKPDRAMHAWEKQMFRLLPLTQRLYRAGVYCLLESRVLGFTTFPGIMKLAERMGRMHIHSHVQDPEKRRQLTPTYRAGCKRILLANDYYQTMARDNVKIITDGIAEVRPNGVVTQDGTLREADVIVFGTGFKIQEMAPRGFFIGVGGRDLADVWAGGAEAYLGTSVAGFPNMFMIVGPNTGLGHNSMIYIIESQVRYIMQAIKTMRARKLRTVDVRPEVVRAYNERLQGMLRGTVWNTGGCKSWYLDANGRNTTLWPTFTFRFRSRLKSFKLGSYITKSAS